MFMNFETKIAQCGHKFQIETSFLLEGFLRSQVKHDKRKLFPTIEWLGVLLPQANSLTGCHHLGHFTGIACEIFQLSDFVATSVIDLGYGEYPTLHSVILPMSRMRFFVSVSLKFATRDIW